MIVALYKSICSLFLVTSLIVSIIFSANSLAINNYYEQAKQSFDEGNYEASFIYLKNALEQNPRDLPSKILKGKILLHRAYFEEAIREFEEAIDYRVDMNLIVADYAAALNFAKRYKQVLSFADGHNLNVEGQYELLLNKAIAYENLDLTTLARRSYEQALRLKPSEPRGFNSFASFEIRSDNLANAERLAKQSIGLNSADNRTIHLLGTIHAEKGEFEQAIEQFQVSLEIIPNEPIVQRSLVRALIQVDRLDDAKMLVEEILKATPNDPHIMLLSSWLLSIDKEDQKSAEMLEALSSTTSNLSDDDFTNDPSLLFVSAISSYLLNNFEQATKELKRYLNLVPGDTRAISTLSDIYLKQGKRQEAELLLERYESSVIADPNLAKTLVDLYINTNKRFDAERLLNKLRMEYPDDLDFVLRLVDLLNKAGRKSEANALMDDISTKDDSNNTKLALAKGLMHLENLELDQATNIAEQLAKQFPENIEIKNLQAAILIKQGDAKSAEGLLEQVLAARPEFFEAEFNYATVFKMQNKRAKAREILERLLEKRPASAQVKFMLGQIYALDEEFDKAIPMLEVIRLGKAGTQSRELLYDIYMATSEFDNALRVIKELNDMSLYNIRYLFNYVRVLAALNKFEEARQQLGVLFGLAENNARLLLDIAIQQRDIEDFVGADKSFAKLLKLVPKNLRVRIEHIRLMLAKGMTAEAEAASKVLEKEVPNEQNVMLLRGDIELTLDRSKKAFEYYWQAIERDPSFNLAVIKLYELARQGIQVEQTTTKLVDLQKQFPEQLWRQRLLADHYMNQNDKTSAQPIYEKLLENDAYRNDAFMLNNVALIKLETDVAEALSYSKQAKELDNSNASITDTLGWIYFKMGQYEQALQTLRNAFAMDASNPTIRYHIGMTLEALQRSGEALSELRVAVKNGERKIWYQAAVAKIAQIESQSETNAASNKGSP